MLQVLRDPPGTKPRIRLIPRSSTNRNYAPAGSAWRWECASPMHTGFGNDPKEAFFHWRGWQCATDSALAGEASK